MTTIEFNKKLICGPEYVSVRIIENCEDVKVGNIWLPQTAEANGRLAFGILESVGSKAAEEYGIKEGDYVMFDRLSTFAHTAPVAAMKYNNVICLTNKEQSDYFPLKNMLFVNPDQKDDISNVNGVYVMNYADRLNTGTIEKMNCVDELPFNVGDKVLLSKGADHVKFGEKEVYIYKHDMIVAKIEG
jgi:co-chaperonin GroES (HSP10)